MSITTECPECQSRYFLQPAMAGKKMRCPTCQSAFLIVPIAETANAPKEQPAGRAELPARPKKRSSSKKAPPPESGPEEYVWSEDNPLLPPGSDDSSTSVELPAARLAPVAYAPAPVPPRSLSKTRGLFLATMALALIAGLIVVAGYVRNYRAKAPDRLWASATEEYKKNAFEAARIQFEEFAKSYPENPHGPEARFLADLCGVRGQVESLLTRQDPFPAVEKLNGFLLRCEERDYRPFAAKDRYGIDLWQSAAKLLYDLVGHARDLLKPETVPAVKKEMETIVLLRQRVAELQPLGTRTDIEQEEAFADLNRKLSDFETRQVFLADWRGRLERPDDAAIRQVREEAVAHNLENDDDVKGMLADAEKSLQKRFAYVPDPKREPGSADGDTAMTGIVFAAKVAANSESRPPVETKRSAAVAVYGTLYGLDLDSGELAWCRPCGDGALAYDLPGESPSTDRVLTVHRRAADTQLELRSTRDGKLLWRQTADLAPTGPPLRFGEKVLLPGRSGPAGDLATITEFGLRRGERLGRMELGAGSGGTALADPQAGRVYWVVDARAAYAFAWPTRVDQPETPRLAEMIPLDTADTGSGSRTLLWPNAPGGERPPLAIRLQPRGERSSALRWMRMATNRLEAAVPAIPIRGTPALDGDRIAFVGDDGAMQVRQLAPEADGRDTLAPVGTFPLPNDAGPNPGEVTWLRFGETGALYFRDGAIWQVRFGFQRRTGIAYTHERLLAGLGELDGVPAISGDIAVLQTHSPSQAGLVSAVDLSDGRLRWKRQLGSRILECHPGQDGVWMFDRSGRVFQVPTAIPQDSTSVQKGSVADAIEGLLDPAVVRETREPAGFMQVGIARRGGEIFLVQRLFEAGKFAPGGDRSFTQQAIKLPAPAAAPPLVLEGEVVVALQDGQLYRIGRDAEPRRQSGPDWRTVNSGTGRPVLLAFGGDRFAVTDGDRKVAVWRSGDFEPLGKLALERPLIALAEVGPAGLVALDDAGGLTRFKPGEPDSLVSEGTAKLTAGAWLREVALLPAPVSGKAGWLVIQPEGIEAFAVGEPKALWRIGVPAGDAILGTPGLDAGGGLTATFGSGWIRRYSLADGGEQSAREIGYARSKPWGPAAELRGGGWLVPMLDGTVQPVR